VVIAHDNRISGYMPVLRATYVQCRPMQTLQTEPTTRWAQPSAVCSRPPIPRKDISEHAAGANAGATPAQPASHEARCVHAVSLSDDAAEVAHCRDSSSARHVIVAHCAKGPSFAYGWPARQYEGGRAHGELRTCHRRVDRA
jgi:hypothetical protein